ncbi:RluA family pseudouridine synthase, partial [Candidatus Aerophobetes bacterium]|nr:RluA family pseudouridine synthase [Candidatus Aerophobetes bacterium]
MQDYYFKVKENKKERVDSFLKSSLSSLSRNFIQQLIKSEKVTVNARAVKSSYS